MTREDREESVSILKAMIPKDSRGNGKVKTNIAITEAILNAVEALEQEEYYKDLAESYEKTINKLIKAIAEQEPCGDCVSRQAVFETIDDCNNDGLKGIFCSYDDGERFKEYIKKLPPVTPTPKTGHWIVGNYHVKCSVCGEDYPYRVRNYCPNCGARMSEVSE